ncbi:MAG: DNA polymerase subunit beta [Thermoprotei archaeon]|mgnify:CR=1 FL=1|nr:MAG: DNA polymerase subunit beta [Thermoprotei archaeon]RLE89474.1 MAG: DNA polymerase subunit beta [Thermoprotei archaeon]
MFEYLEVRYDESRWRLLESKRRKAVEVMSLFEEYGLKTYVYGSLARGDVKRSSDIDIIIKHPPLPSIVEGILKDHEYYPIRREVIRATPRHTPKGYIHLCEDIVISFPLLPLSRLEVEFYKFSGELDLEGIKKGLRVPGVDKRLMLILPTNWGHIEYSIIGRESEVAKRLGVSIAIVEERENILLKRHEKGRTGVFFKRILNPIETFEDILSTILDYT